MKWLKEKYVSEPDLNYTVLGADCEFDQLLASLNGYPFMSQKRMTVVREFYPKQDLFKKGLKSFFENPSPDGIFVILNEKPFEALKKFAAAYIVGAIRHFDACMRRDGTDIAKRENEYDAIARKIKDKNKK